jgi:beta-lactamase superfamily II metal-dependent hydrolase
MLYFRVVVGLFVLNCWCRSILAASEPNQKEKQNDRWIEHHINRHEQNAKTEIPARDANVTDNPVLKPIDDNNNNNNNSLIIRLFETNSKALMTLN